MRTLSLLILFTFTFLSCEDRRGFEIEGLKQEVVLNSVISTDSIWEVSLNYTKSISDLSDFEKIENASVKVINITNGQSFFLQEKEKGRYCRQLNPVEGHEYALSVEIENEDIVRATTYVPSVLDVEVLSQSQLDSNGDPTLEIDIAISDNPDEDNFYVWDLRPYVVENEENLPVINPSAEIPSVLTSSSTINNNENVIEEETSRPLLSTDDTYEYVAIGRFDASGNSDKSRSFNSSTYVSDKNTIEGKIYNRLLLKSEILADINISDDIIVTSEGSGTAGTNGKKPIFQLNVRAVSAELYEYLQTYETYRQNNIKNTSVIAPSEIYSNIENGTGIFGGYNLKTFNIY